MTMTQLNYGTIEEIFLTHKPSSIIADIAKGKLPKSDFDFYYNKILAGGMIQEPGCEEFISNWNPKNPIRCVVNFIKEEFHETLDCRLHRNLEFFLYPHPEKSIYYLSDSCRRRGPYGNSIINVQKDFSSLLLRFKNFVKDSGLLPKEFADKHKWTFKKVLKYFNENYFQSWGEESIPAGSLFVKICDFLEIPVRPIGTTPDKWDIEEYVFREWVEGAKSHKNAHAVELKNFARLFSLPPSRWYANHWTSLVE